MGLTLAGFVAGSVVATFHAPLWGALPALGAVSLGEELGWWAAVALQLAACALVAGATWWGERRGWGTRRPSAAAPGVVPDAGLPGSARPTAPRGWARLLQGPWPLAAGAVGLAALNALTLVLAGHPWGITWAFTLWGGKALQAVGYDLSVVPFWQGEFAQAALAAPLLADVTTVMDLGLVLGAFLAAGLAGRFAPSGRLPLRVAAASLLGGLLLGYGARIAFGCNIGAYFSGIASTSLHGWLWGAAALLGTPVGVSLRRLAGVDRAGSAAPTC